MSHSHSLLTHPSFWQLLPADPGGALPEPLLWSQEPSQPERRTGQKSRGLTPPRGAPSQGEWGWRVAAPAPCPFGGTPLESVHTVSHSPQGDRCPSGGQTENAYPLPSHPRVTCHLHVTASWNHLLNKLLALATKSEGSLPETRKTWKNSFAGNKKMAFVPVKPISWVFALCPPAPPARGGWVGTRSPGACLSGEPGREHPECCLRSDVTLPSPAASGIPEASILQMPLHSASLLSVSNFCFQGVPFFSFLLHPQPLLYRSTK